MDTASHIRRRYEAAAIVLCVLAFFLYAFLALTTPRTMFSSPDENANYVFAERFRDRMTFAVPLALDLPAEQSALVHPRSTITVDGAVLPQSFLGLPLLYGALGVLLPTASLLVFLTPLVAAAGVFAFFLLIRRLFNERIGLASAALLATHPAFLYYANRGMFHNVPFLALLIIAAYFLVRGMQDNHWRSMAFGGLFLGLGVSMRPSEVIWVGLVLALLLLVVRARPARRLWLSGIVGGAAGILPLLVANATTYGSPLAFGYLAGGAGGGGNGEGSSLGWALSLIFPFGVNVARTIEAVQQYFVLFLFWYFIPFALGVVRVVLSVLRREQLPSAWRVLPRWCFVFLLVFLWQTLYYGSWDFHEFMGDQSAILGSSFLRYWLPVLALSLPIAVYGLSIFLHSFRRATTRALVVVGVGAVMATLSFQMGFGAPLYGLLAVHENLHDAATLRTSLDAALPADAVVIAGTTDKILFPTYAVITTLDFSLPAHQSLVETLTAQRPVYLLLNSLEGASVQTFKDARVHGIHMKPVASMGDALMLYSVSSK